MKSIIYLVFLVLMIVSLWKIFEKAGKPGWACIIPIYNILILLEIVGKPWWWLLLMLIPGVNIVFAIWMTNLLSLTIIRDNLIIKSHEIVVNSRHTKEYIPSLKKPSFSCLDLKLNSPMIL